MDKAGIIEHLHQEIIKADWAKYFEVVKEDELEERKVGRTPERIG